MSFVIPVYNEAATLTPLVEAIIFHSGSREIEILLVDDGSTDGSSETIGGLAEKNSAVRGLSLGGHRGKTAALKAGFEHASGDIVFTLDSDLQDDPADMHVFLERLSEGYDLVCGWKRERNDPRSRVWASRIYNRVVRGLFGVELMDVNCGFKAMRREVAVYLSVDLKRDYHRLIPVLAQRAGYRIGEVVVTHRARPYGRSKYGAWRYAAAMRDVVLLRFFR